MHCSAEIQWGRFRGRRHQVAEGRQVCQLTSGLAFGGASGSRQCQVRWPQCFATDKLEPFLTEMKALDDLVKSFTVDIVEATLLAHDDYCRVMK